MTTSPAAAFHLRNAVTYTALLLGLGAVWSAVDGRTAQGGALIALAVIADTFDGRFARLFRHDGPHAALGGELDSLCDACTFGLAPVACTAALARGTAADTLCLAAGGLYLAATVTRLAFFNVTRQSVPGFVGLPAPVAALLWATTLCITRDAAALAAVLLGAAGAMVAPWRLPRPLGAGLLAFAAWPLVVVVLHVMAR